MNILLCTLYSVRYLDKFDEIFNSAKYKNCLNSIKDVIKKLREEAKHKKTCMGFYK